MSEVTRRRLILTFPQKLQLREWLVTNHKYICEQLMTRDTCAEEATKTLGFKVHSGHLPDIIRTIPDLKWNFTHIHGTVTGVSQEELDAVKDQLALMEIGITDINSKLAILQSQYESVSKEISEIRTGLAARVVALEESSKHIVLQIAAMSETMKGMNQSLNMAMDQLGFEKLDDVLHKGLAAVAKAKPPIPTIPNRR